MTAGIHTYRVRGWCVIGGKEYPCGQISTNYGINTIPDATAILAVGTDIFSGADSPAMAGISEVTRQGDLQKASLYIQLGGAGHWYSPVKIFDGYLGGLGFARVHEQLALSIHLIHYLSDLHYTSCLTTQSQIPNIAQINKTAIYLGESGAGGFRVGFLNNSPNLYAELSEFESDVGKALLHIFDEIARIDLMVIGEPSECFGPNNTNQFARDAIARIATGGGVGRGNGFSGAVVARFDVGSAVFYDSLASWVQRQLDESYFLTPIWDKLANVLAPALYLAIIPRVDKSLLIPFSPCLKGYGETIRVTEEERINLQALVHRPLRAVAVLTGGTSIDGAIGNEAMQEAGGCYGPPRQQRGAVLFADAPGWLANVPDFVCGVTISALGASRRDSSEKRAIHTALTPAVTAGANSQLAEEAAIAFRETRSLADRYAQSLYFQERFRGRRGTVSTNLRWDIAPGSTIAIEAPNSAKRGTIGIGIVERMSIWADAEASNCGTAFQLGCCRTEQENEEMGLAEHPLYSGKPFNGATLADD